ncbi:hypothetical protein HZA76_03090 [Candidatus Roizmanbacteria bacterium]|nr:hypothetical protein [Candidatus Roizmanbacteria bacterium]
MNPGDAEQNPQEKNAAQSAAEVAKQLILEIRQERAAQLEAIANEGDPDKAQQLRDQLSAEIQKELKDKLHLDADQAKEAKDQNKQEDFEKNAKEVKKTILEAKEMLDKDIHIGDQKTETLIKEIASLIEKGEITDDQTVAIERGLDRWLSGAEKIVLSTGDQKSNFEKAVDSLLDQDQEAGRKIVDFIKKDATDFGQTAEKVAEKFDVPKTEAEIRDAFDDQLGSEAFRGDLQYYSKRFTTDQINLLEKFYSPKKFLAYLEEMEIGVSSGNKVDPERLKYIKERKDDLRRQLKEHSQETKQEISESKLNELVEKNWMQEVSREINWKVSEVVNQLFLELQQKRPDKFYEEIMQEDIFQGPAQIQHAIQRALNTLYSKFSEIEKNERDPLHDKVNNLNIKLYRYAAPESYIDERDGKVYPRLKPLPFGQDIPLSEFIQYLNVTIDHTIHRTEYFHNARAMFNHPPGEKGFYSQLGGYAESLKGTDIDEIMLLPDGQYVLQAYHLYEKMLEEDFASLDWRHRPDQFTNQLQRINSKIEQEVIDMLGLFYPSLSRERVRNIVNSAVGIGRGMFLTEAEKSAYADPVDAEGSGMVASYSTNDSGSLTVFNPLHVALRWQGEHLWNMMYFMPVEGTPGKAWNHKQAWVNMGKYMNSFLSGKAGGGRGDIPLYGVKKPYKIFADEMIDLLNVGGPAKRKGWRMLYSMEGHYVYDKDAEGKATFNALQTFKAMEAIGYESIFNFIDTQLKSFGGDLLKATEGKGLQRRNELFKYMFKRYFFQGSEKEFQENDFNNYMKDLTKEGEESAFKKVREGKASGDNWDEIVQNEISLNFLEDFLAHYVAERFPSKFLRMDRNRFHAKGVSRWESTYQQMKSKGWERAKFDKVMKDMTMTEMLFRRKISELIRAQIGLDKELTLDKIENLPYRLDEKTIRELLSKNADGKEGFLSNERIEDVVALFKQIKINFDNFDFLNDRASEEIRKYSFTFGLEDTDVSLMAFRGTGPRMIARAIKDTGSLEAEVVPWILNMPQLLNEIATNGSYDFSKIIEYLKKAQMALTMVHGPPATYEYVYKIAGLVINYFKKDTIAKPLFGLFGQGRLNSIAAEYAGRGTAVWEWDVRDIDNFITAMESNRLLPKQPFDMQGGKIKGPKYENIWWKLPFLDKHIKFPLLKKLKVDFPYNSTKMRADFGASGKDITLSMIYQFLPILGAFLIWQYINKAREEAEGKKK